MQRLLMLTENRWKIGLKSNSAALKINPQLKLSKDRDYIFVRAEVFVGKVLAQCQVNGSLFYIFSSLNSYENLCVTCLNSAGLLFFPEFVILFCVIIALK